VKLLSATLLAAVIVGCGSSGGAGQDAGAARQRSTAPLYRVLAAVGLSAPHSKLSVIFWLLLYRLRARAAGLQFEPRDPAGIAPENRLRIEAMYAAAMGFAVVNVLLAICMQARLLLRIRHPARWNGVYLPGKWDGAKS